MGLRWNSGATHAPRVKNRFSSAARQNFLAPLSNSPPNCREWKMASISLLQYLKFVLILNIKKDHQPLFEYGLGKGQVNHEQYWMSTFYCCSYSKISCNHHSILMIHWYSHEGWNVFGNSSILLHFCGLSSSSRSSNEYWETNLNIMVRDFKIEFRYSWSVSQDANLTDTHGSVHWHGLHSRSKCTTQVFRSCRSSTDFNLFSTEWDWNVESDLATVYACTST